MGLTGGLRFRPELGPALMSRRHHRREAGLPPVRRPAVRHEEGLVDVVEGAGPEEAADDDLVHVEGPDGEVAPRGAPGLLALAAGVAAGLVAAAAEAAAAPRGTDRLVPLHSRPATRATGRRRRLGGRGRVHVV